ncbi:dihydrodipicolinate synthase family protein, partial [Staphylococcus aureus]|uniref:dihydrodipicolinate synthase family protein n=1 Tax=Staphylococcus aureus TaxID=1280 RepID=UPI0016425507
SGLTPLYYPFTFQQITHYYFDIIQRTHNNIIIYPIPHLTPINISIQQFNHLFNHQKIVGLKYTPPNFFLLQPIT